VKVRGADGAEEVEGDDEGEAQVGAQPQGGPASAEQLAYTQRLRKVRDRYEQALREQHPESTKLRALMGFASEKADEKKDYAAAAQALDVLDKLLSAPVASPGTGRPGAGAGDLVAKRTFLLTRWRRIPADLWVELATLLKAIRTDYPAVDLASLGKGIDAKLGELIEQSQARLAAAVDEDINGGDRAYRKTAAQIRSVRGDVAANEMVTALRENAFTAGAAFEAAFAKALDEVEVALTA
jgi:hypothetical protein